MYRIGDIVMYPGTGVCRVEDIVTQKFARTEEKTYYVLKGVYDTADTTIYCPVDNKNIKLRKLLSKDSITDLINKACVGEKLWIDNDNERKKLFASVLKEGDQIKILKLIIEIHENKVEKEKEGKQLHLSDEKILQQAEKIIHEELAYSMDIKIDEVAAFIMHEMNIEI